MNTLFHDKAHILDVRMTQSLILKLLLYSSLVFMLVSGDMDYFNDNTPGQYQSGDIRKYSQTNKTKCSVIMF